MFKRLFVPALVFGAAALAPPSEAQVITGRTACGVRDVITQRLEQKFGETRKGVGVISADRLIELWGSVETGSWTILITRANGTTCILAAGDYWHDVPVDFRLPGDPV